MKRFVTSVFLACLFLLQGAPADAAGAWPSLPEQFKFLGGGDPVPVEWEGAWTVIDTMYQCTGQVMNVFTSDDTLCSGEVFYADTTATNFICTGTSTATTINLHCTGSNEVFPECNGNFDITIVGTRTADTYFTVFTSSTTFSGTGKNCDLFPPQCIQINSHGTRTGPVAPGYCSTPAFQTSWGKVKSQYR